MSAHVRENMFRKDAMWAITAYFDPLSSGRRLHAYREFRRHLSVPLITVELSYNGAFDLGPDDADILVQLHGGAALWQKERMLNIALRWLPAHCDSVAWLDCDVVFTRPDWAVAARRQLRDFAIIQPFDQLYYLSASDSPRIPNGGKPHEYFDSFAARFVNGTLPEDWFREVAASRRFRFTPGMAWVAQRRILEEHGFYDTGVIGGGDSLMRAAACGHYEDRASALRMSPHQHLHYRTWAKAFHKAIQGRISYLEGKILHLWHGDLDNRRYKERYAEFDRFDFDPRRDLAQTPEGAWCWNSDKPELHAYVKSHFEFQDQAWRESQPAGGD
jgi:hypothetical protein